MNFRLTAADWASFSRILIAPLVLVLMSDWAYAKWLVLFTVWVAMVSDYLDGYWARKYNTVSDFGAFLDFTADKIYVMTLLTVFLVQGWMPIWMFLVILNRELLVMGLRIYAAIEGLAVHARSLGKLKTGCTFSALIAVLTHEFVGNYFSMDLAWIPYLFLLGAVILTVVSGADYVINVLSHVQKMRASK